LARGEHSYSSGKLKAEQGSRRTRRHPRDDPRAEVGEDVGVRVRVGAVECQLYTATAQCGDMANGMQSGF